MEIIVFVDKYGKKRKGVEKKCDVCDKMFNARIDQDCKYCSVSCKNTARRNRDTVTCANCRVQFQKKVSSKSCSRSGLYFCTRKCKDEAQCIGGIEEIMPSHYGKSSGREVHRFLIERTDNPCCVDCDEPKRYFLVVHHIDGDTKNNSLGNLEIVCGKCHMKRHLKPTDSGWVYDPHVLTPRHMLSSL